MLFSRTPALNKITDLTTPTTGGTGLFANCNGITTGNLKITSAQKWGAFGVFRKSVNDWSFFNPGAAWNQTIQLDGDVIAIWTAFADTFNTDTTVQYIP